MPVCGEEGGENGGDACSYSTAASEGSETFGHMHHGIEREDEAGFTTALICTYNTGEGEQNRIHTR